MANRDAQTAFGDRERELIEAVAQERGISFEEAVNQLASEGLANRVRKRTGRRPASQVVRFRRR